ncbi:oxygenase MpaB family protein [Gulosibacter bifidus]|uniref:Oxygenase MpaB family protein n=1 Tax=Gulosibacter bifidus TaxID=272239 RepID=A0ABW5RGY6_9MICO|nr:oxygenase MpaB family protein [Gulosibacter bifidus]
MSSEQSPPAPPAEHQPSEAFRKFAAEGVVLAGGGTAILLQLAHPQVAAGVANHSNFADAPMRRLWGTLEFVTAEAFGNQTEQQFVRRRVNAQHARVQGLDEHQQRYDANNPHDQWWVAATLCWSAIRAYRRVYGRRSLTANDLDAIVRDFGRMGTGLRMPAASWPQTAAEFDRKFAAQLVALEVGDAARFAKAELFAARHAAWWLRAIMPFATRIAVSLLPPHLAAAYGHPQTRASRFIANLCWIPVVLAGRILPRTVRTLPATLVLNRVRTRAATRR